MPGVRILLHAGERLFSSARGDRVWRDGSCRARRVAVAALRLWGEVRCFNTREHDSRGDWIRRVVHPLREDAVAGAGFVSSSAVAGGFRVAGTVGFLVE